MNSSPTHAHHRYVINFGERSEEEWAARRAGTNGEALTKSGAGPLMTPIKQLFDFHRVRDVAPGESGVVEFEVSAAAIAEVDEKTGDLVSEAASYTLMFDDGAGQLVNMPAKVTGKRTVLDEYRVQGRGGQGIINIKVSERNGAVVGCKAVAGRSGSRFSRVRFGSTMSGAALVA